MKVTAKVDYALQALLELAASERPMSGRTLAAAQHISFKFLHNILTDLARAGMVRNRRGVDGGYLLARPAASITAAEVIRAVDGPIGHVRGLAPDVITYPGPAANLALLWSATAASLRNVLENVTLADLLTGEVLAARTFSGERAT